MWVLLSSRVRTWLLLAVLVPVARRALRQVAERTAPVSRATRTLHAADSALSRVDRRERKARARARRRAA